MLKSLLLAPGLCLVEGEVAGVGAPFAAARPLSYQKKDAAIRLLASRAFCFLPAKVLSPGSIKQTLVLYSFIAIFLTGIADATTVTITASAPIETLSADGSVTGVSAAVPGTHYKLVKYTAVGMKGTPVVTLADDQNQIYRVNLSATDYTPAASEPTTNAESGAASPATTTDSVSGKMRMGLVSWADLPPAVQKTAETHLAGKTVGKVERVNDSGDVTFEIEIKNAKGEGLGLTVAEDGTLLSTETTLASVPTAVQAAVKTAIGEGKLDGIDKTLEDGETTYTAGITTNGQEHDFIFKADGTLSSEEVERSNLPPAVQAAITGAMGQGKLEGMEKTFDGGEISYVANIVGTNGREHDFTFEEDGTLSSQEVDRGDLPSVVQSAITTAMGQGKLEGIDKTFEDGETTYTVGITTNGRELDYVFKEDGTLSSQEMAMADLPAAVQTTLKANLGNAKLEEIDEMFDDGVTTYTVNVTAGGHERDFSISADGTMLSREVMLTETPAAVQNTIAQTLGDGKVVRIDQSLDAAKHSYDIEGQKDGKEFDFTVGPRGKFLGMDD